MDKNVSIVEVDKRHYRVIARENWGLTREQMKGKHVHHRIPVSRGGTNDPSNLYVCSPGFHRWGWHNGEEWIEWAEKGGKKGGYARPIDVARSNGIKAKESGQLLEAARKGGKVAGAINGRLPFWNNGIKTVRSRTCPGEGWVKGLAEKWWKKDGLESKQINCPGEGWVRGRKTPTEETKRKKTESTLGKTWWVNREGLTVKGKSQPGPDWQKGRKFHEGKSD